MGKVDIDLSDFVSEPEEVIIPEEIKKNKEGLLNPYDAEWREYLKDRKQYTIGSIPKKIIEDIEKEYKRLGMTKIEYFYHILREMGFDIPAYEKMDRRVQ